MEYIHILSLIHILRKEKITPFFVGCMMYFITVVFIENSINTLLYVGIPGFSDAMEKIPVLYILYGCLTAGIFEEVGRFAAFRMMGSKAKTANSALMFGSGFGGAEALVVVGISMLSNITTAYLVNWGDLNSLTADMSAEQLSQFADSVNAMAAVSYTHLVKGCERVYYFIDRR